MCYGIQFADNQPVDEEAEAKAVDLFRSLALPSPETIGSRYPHQVSGGQLQRLMAAMALITRVPTPVPLGAWPGWRR